MAPDCPSQGTQSCIDCAARRGSIGLERSDGSQGERAQAQSLLGKIAWHLFSPARALPHFQKAADLVEEQHRRSDGQAIDTWDRLGLAYHTLGKDEQAVHWQRKALALASRSGTRLQQVRLKRRLANTLQDYRHFHAAADLMAEIRPGADTSVADRVA